MTLNAVYGLTQALHWNTKWDYFINLSASDLPLLRTVRHISVICRGRTNASCMHVHKNKSNSFFFSRKDLFASENVPHQSGLVWRLCAAGSALPIFSGGRGVQEDTAVGHVS